MKRLTQDNFKVLTKRRLLDTETTITALARRIGKARNTVSMAINHPIFPTVRALIVEELPRLKKGSRS